MRQDKIDHTYLVVIAEHACVRLDQSDHASRIWTEVAAFFILVYQFTNTAFECCLAKRRLLPCPPLPPPPGNSSSLPPHAAHLSQREIKIQLHRCIYSPWDLELPPSLSARRALITVRNQKSNCIGAYSHPGTSNSLPPCPHAAHLSQREIKCPSASVHLVTLVCTHPMQRVKSQGTRRVRLFI